MKLTACAALALLFTNTAVFADPPDDFAQNDRAYYGSGAAHLDGCVQLMERAFYLADPASLDRAIDARHEMDLAREAFHDGDAFGCRDHAMHALEDRS